VCREQGSERGADRGGAGHRECPHRSVDRWEPFPAGSADWKELGEAQPSERCPRWCQETAPRGSGLRCCLSEARNDLVIRSDNGDPWRERLQPEAGAVYSS
jgi:hypothetical protein